MLYLNTLFKLFKYGNIIFSFDYINHDIFEKPYISSTYTEFDIVLVCIKISEINASNAGEK